jgi:hypothetical protein
MQQIRERAWDGLMAAPRVGMAVGGLLLGVRHAGRIRVLDSIEIPCSHSIGPSFNLTPEEKRETMAMIAEAGTLSATSKVGVIGWYCSKTRGDTTLNAADLSFYSELFPDPGQIALVVRPSNLEPMRATFFFRDEKGEVITGVESLIDEWRPESSVESDPADTGPPEPSPAAPAVTNVRPSFFGAPSLPPAAPSRRIGKLGWALGAIASIAAGASIFLTQDSWMPRPQLSLSSSELNGTLLIRWNPEALRGIDHASMYVNDGGQRIPTLITLDRFQLNSGLLSYTPKSKRVTAKLNAGEQSALTAWFAPLPPPAPAVAAQPPQKP